MQAEVINRRLVKFIWAAAIFFAWTLIQGAIQEMVPAVRALTQQGPGSMITGVHTHMGLMGWMSMALMAAIYYIVPIISGKSIVWPKLIDWIFWIFAVSGVVACVLLLIGGVVGGSAFAAGVKGPQLTAVITPYVLPSGILCTISAIAGVMFVVQILVSLSRRS
jgi:cytochrome c oxidase cbb3-type subunit 1